MSPDLDDDGASVHVLYPAPDEVDGAQPVTRERPYGDRDQNGQLCFHDRVRLDLVAHRVYCRGCNREVDPFEVLERMARDWDTYSFMRQEAKRQARQAQANLEDLRRRERNAKARVRRRERD